MSQVCQITKKKPVSGNWRSHSHVASKRTFAINLQSKRLLNPATGKYMRIKLSTNALKTLKKWEQAGKIYDLRQLIQA